MFECSCGKMIADNEVCFEVWVDDECHEFVCEECAKEFAQEETYGHTVEIYDAQYPFNRYYICSSCGELVVASEMTTNKNDGSLICKNCLK